jgi:SAM-dependent methyltransferase
MAGRDYWLSIAQSADADDLREHILTGFKGGKPFTPYLPTIQLPSATGRVLDFGCGVGRTFPFLRRIAGHVTGFDLPPMIERCRTLAAEPADALVDDWTTLRTERFDLIVSVLVLQHIEPATCSDYLRDFARMAPAIYLLSRADNDFGSNVFATIASTGLFDVPGDSVEVEHDPVTNQLRVLGRRSFGEICAPDTAGHFEVLLRSRSAA